MFISYNEQINANMVLRGIGRKYSKKIKYSDTLEYLRAMWYTVYNYIFTNKILL